jgi:hypothetical protein
MATRVQYSKKTGAGRWAGIILGGVLLLVAAGIVIKVPPDRWWVEAGVLILTGLGLYLIKGWKLTTGIVGLMMLQRLGIMNFWTLGVFIIILGLISLIN